MEKSMKEWGQKLNREINACYALCLVNALVVIFIMWRR